MEELGQASASGLMTEDEIRSLANKYGIKGTYGLPNGKVITIK